MKINFMGTDNYFSDNLIAPEFYNYVGLDYFKDNHLTYTHGNSFFSFFIMVPDIEGLTRSVGVKTPLVRSDTLLKIKSPDFPSYATVSMGLKNSCLFYFEPIVTGDTIQSYNKITDVTLYDSSTYTADGQRYIEDIFDCKGELATNFMINGEKQIVTANYRFHVRAIKQK